MYYLLKNKRSCLLVYFLIISSLAEKPGSRSFCFCFHNTKLSRIIWDIHKRHQVDIHVYSFLVSKSEKKKNPKHQSPSLQVFPAINVAYLFSAIKVKGAVGERFSGKF